MIQFLKPIFVKITLFVAMAFSAVFIGTNFFDYIDRLNETGPIPITFYVHLNSFFWFPFKLLYEGSIEMILYNGEMEKIALPFLSSIVYWYLLSCTIIFIFGKLKKLLILRGKS